MDALAGNPAKAYFISMEQKYMIAFTRSKEKTTLSYINRYRMERELKKNHISYTYDFGDEYTDVLYGSADDYTILHNRVKKEAKTSILALGDERDFLPDKKGRKVLTQDASDSYKKADTLYIFNEEDKILLFDISCSGEIKILGNEEEKPRIETDYFRSYYQAPKGKKLFVIFKKIYTKEDIECVETIARLYPEMLFISFYSGAIDLIQDKTRDRLMGHDNLHLFAALEEELYESMLMSVDGILLIGQEPFFQQLIIDCKRYKVPIVAYQIQNPSELLKEANTSYAQDYSGVYRTLQKIATTT